MTIIWSGHRKPRYTLFVKEHCLFTYLIFKLLLYCVARSSLPYSSSQIPLLVWRERESGETMHERKTNIVVWETVEWIEYSMNIIIFIKQDLPDACFRCHVDDIEILRAFAWLRSNRRNLCLFSQNVRRSVAHNRDNNKQTITHLTAWRISFAIRSKGKLSVYCRYTRKRTKDQCCVRNLSVEYNCTNCKWSIVTCLIMHHTTYDTPYERYRSS